jgi:hypothetical protein
MCRRAPVSIRVLTLELSNSRLNGSFKLAITLLIAPPVFSLVDHQRVLVHVIAQTYARKMSLESLSGAHIGELEEL